MEKIQGSPRVASVSEYVSRTLCSRSRKGCVPLGIYRVEDRGCRKRSTSKRKREAETNGHIDGIRIVGLQGAAGHNGSIEGLDVHLMPCNPPWEVTWLYLGESRDLMGTDRTHGATNSVGCPIP